MKLLTEPYITSLLGFVHPESVLEAAHHLRNNSEYAKEWLRLELTASGAFRVENSPALKLVALFLEAFRLPDELLGFCEKMAPGIIDSQTRKELSELRFTGRLLLDSDPLNQVPGRAELLAARKMTYVCAINMPRVEQLLVGLPLKTMLNEISHFANYWQCKAERESSRAFHHEHGVETRLLAALDADIARCMGYSLIGCGGCKSSLFRHATFFGTKVAVLAQSISASDFADRTILEGHSYE